MSGHLVTVETVRAALAQVRDPDRGADIVALGMVQGLAVKDGHVAFTIEVDAKRGPGFEPVRKAAEKAVDALPGVLSVTAVLTAEAAPRSAPPTAPAPAVAPAIPGLPGVRHIIAVASGKGGVGKSTTAVNLALGMAAEGWRVGMLDADIYGPSQPRMLGLAGRPSSADGKRLTPLKNYGIVCMSMGFMVPEDTPMIWRGPMVMGAIEQMLRDVDWGSLDVLVVDMPPGTGDAQLTLAQKVPLAGAVIVSTPQDIALLDARRGLGMFQKVNVPVLGIIENMSYYLCPNCGHRAEIFAHGGARREAEKLGCEFLGELPLDIEIRETADAGRPVTVSRPDSPHAQSYRAIARRLIEKLDGGAGARPAPRIVIG